MNNQPPLTFHCTHPGRLFIYTAVSPTLIAFQEWNNESLKTVRCKSKSIQNLHCNHFAPWNTSLCKLPNKILVQVTLTPLSSQFQVRAWHKTWETNPFLHAPPQTTSFPAAPGQKWYHFWRSSSGYLFLQSKSKVLVLSSSRQAAPGKTEAEMC